MSLSELTHYLSRLAAKLETNMSDESQEGVEEEVKIIRKVIKKLNKLDHAQDFLV